MKTLIILAHLFPTILLWYPLSKDQPITQPVIEKPLITETVSTPAEESIEQYTERRSNEVFGEGQFEALNTLIHKESGYRADAQNPRSTAYGIFQFLNGTWAGTGINKTNDPKLQVEAGLIYIKNRFGSPKEAWEFWQINHWY